MFKSVRPEEPALQARAPAFPAEGGGTGVADKSVGAPLVESVKLDPAVAVAVALEAAV